MRERGGNALFDIGRVLEPNGAHADGFGHRREIRILEFRAGGEETAGLLLELEEPERTVVEHDDLHRQTQLRQAEEITHQHGKSAVTRERNNPPTRERGLRADRLRHRIGHGAVPE
jgi:hypothetical protein